MKLNPAPLTNRTNFVVPKTDDDATYSVRAILDGAESADPDQAIVLDRPYLSIPLKTPAGYAPNDASAADLDGNGVYEIVLHQTGRGQPEFRGNRLNDGLSIKHPLTGLPP